MNRPILVLFVALLLNCEYATYSQEASLRQRSEQQRSQGKVLMSLISTNWDERLKAAVTLDEQRAQLIGELMAILRSSNSDQVKASAVVVLGEYRASEAVPLLVRHFEWDEGSHRLVIIHRPGNREEFALQQPVSSALYRIGLPAVLGLMDRMAETDDKEIVRKCVSICERIEGPEVAELRLRLLSEKEIDQKRKLRLQSALAGMRKVKAGE